MIRKNQKVRKLNIALCGSVWREIQWVYFRPFISETVFLLYSANFKVHYLPNVLRPFEESR